MLTVENISCRRGARVLFRDVGFTLEQGGFLYVTGANGSGKSSLLRILAGLIPPASGAVRWRGVNSADDAAYHENLHYIGHLDGVKPVLTVREMLSYWAALRGVAADITAACDAFGLGGLIDRPVRHLSAGQKRRLSLTRLTMGAAFLWLLDEPTTALDNVGRDLLFAQIARHRAAGGAVVVATHDVLNLPGAQKLPMGAT